MSQAVYGKINNRSSKSSYNRRSVKQQGSHKRKRSIGSSLRIWDRRSGLRKSSNAGIISTLFDFKFNHDKKLFIMFIVLLVIGIIAIFSSSITFGSSLKGNRFYYLISQIKWITVGFVFMSIFYFIKPYVFVRFWYFPLSISIVLLGYLMVQSLSGNEGINGANRWLDVGGFSFQPSDFAKLAFVIFIAAFLSNKKNHYLDFKEYLKENFIPFVFWFFLILFLILVGNTNLGTATVIGFIGITSYAVSATTKYHYMGLLILVVVMTLGGLAFAFHEQYRMDRVAVWTNYWKTGDTLMKDDDCPNRQGCWYQYHLVLTSLGTGGVLGIGAGESTGKHYFVQTTAGDDGIIGIIGEEWGFIATSGTLLLYLYLVLRCVNIAKEFVDKPIYFFLMTATSSRIGFQAFVHYGANTGIIPLTGQTLPFISLGGSSLVSLMCAMGLILNVSKQRDIKED